MRSLNKTIKSDRLATLKKFHYKHKRFPTYEEMLPLFSVASKNAIFKIVQKWIDEGILAKDRNQLIPTHKFYSLPLLGVIKAGLPTLEPHYEGEGVYLGDFLVNNPGYTYVLKVSGDSMIGEGIRPGDLVILDKMREPKNKDVIAAFVDNEWTLKFYNNNQGQVYLTAANPNYSPIFPKETLVTGGVVIKVIRNYY